MKIPKLRPYQDKGIGLVRKAYADGKRKILFWLATGGGKSVIFLALIVGMLMNRKRIIFVVKRKQLVFQTQRHLQKSGIDCSVMIADHAGFDPSKPIQICSIDTVIRRDMEFLRGFDFVIVDEAHDATSPSYQKFLKECEELGIGCFIGLTATPFEVNGQSHDFWDSCVKPIEVHELCEQGFLVPDDLYIPDSGDNIGEGIKKVKGDYNEKQLAAKMQKLEYIGDAIELYNKHGRNRVGIFFAVNVEHSKAMALEFQRAGIAAVHCDQGTPQKERDAAIALLKEHARAGKPFILCNVNIFSTGTDIPEAEVGFMRPTLSECLYIQQIGRLLRPYRLCGKCNSQYDNSPLCPVCGYDRPSYVKEYATILDMGGNTDRFGRAFDVRYPALGDGVWKEKEKKERPLIKKCKDCKYIYNANLPSCPKCGSDQTREKFFKTKAGELRPYNEYESMKRGFTKLQTLALEYRWKPNRIYFEFYRSFGDSCMKYQKEFGLPAWLPKLYKESQEKKLEGKLYK